MDSKKATCLNCTKRSLACHGTCEDYKAEKERFNAEKAEKQKDSLIRAYKNESVDNSLSPKQRKVRKIGNNK